MFESRGSLISGFRKNKTHATMVEVYRGRGKGSGEEDLFFCSDRVNFWFLGGRPEQRYFGLETKKVNTVAV